jgi:hypothetical protein
MVLPPKKTGQKNCEQPTDSFSQTSPTQEGAVSARASQGYTHALRPIGPRIVSTPDQVIIRHRPSRARVGALCGHGMYAMGRTVGFILTGLRHDISSNKVSWEFQFAYLPATPATTLAGGTGEQIAIKWESALSEPGIGRREPYGRPVGT